MCGRYVLRHTLEQLIDYYGAVPEGFFEIPPSYNVAPTFEMPVVKMNGEKKLERYRWGLLPGWAKDEKISYKLINARSETLSEKPSYRSAFKQRRCVIPATGFYEWKKTPDGKIPHYIFSPDGHPLSFAGLYEHWERDGKAVDSFTIITTDASEKMSALHDRMPAILFGNEIEGWLDPNGNPDHLKDLLQSAPNDAIEYYPVSTQVNSPKNQGAELIERED